MKRVRRRRRVRSRVRGTSDCPRLSVFRSNRHISAQLIDDAARTTLASASDAEAVQSRKKPLKRQDLAQWVGKRIAEKAEAQGIRRVRFDRGSYRYHGLVQAVAEGARKGGLKL